ncbi:hypothetical protein RHGRI_013191 [Rhododendron griersonianum]|uniref:Uncharacterized protein n=1 Tax=Rhododendron griersonianum TaxID=479676 RepID=A0AAV6K4M1_9ERIC|nr:hypothetical protein RHGRI_013191 [Rhododendron griersonianum]
MNCRSRFGYQFSIPFFFSIILFPYHAAAVAAAAAGRYTFMCRQDDNAPLSPVPDWYDLFHVNGLAYYKNLENDVLVLRSDDSFCMPREYFLEERSELLEIVFVSTLYRVDIPRAVKESIFDEVIRLARLMVVDDGNNVVHRQVLPMTVEIVISENEEEMSARTLRDSRVDEAFPEMYQEAVGEWAISQVTGGLEKVALESCSVKPRCAICLDTILVNGPFAVLALKRSMDKVFSNELIVFQILCYVDDFHSMAFAWMVCRNWCNTLHSIEKRRGFFGHQAKDCLKRLAEVQPVLQIQLQRTLKSIDRLPSSGPKILSINSTREEILLRIQAANC